MRMRVAKLVVKSLPKITEIGKTNSNGDNILWTHVFYHGEITAIRYALQIPLIRAWYSLPNDFASITIFRPL